MYLFGLNLLNTIPYCYAKIIWFLPSRDIFLCQNYQRKLNGITHKKIWLYDNMSQITFLHPVKVYLNKISTRIHPIPAKLESGAPAERDPAILARCVPTYLLRKSYTNEGIQNNKPDTHKCRRSHIIIIVCVICEYICVVCACDGCVCDPPFEVVVSHRVLARILRWDPAHVLSAGRPIE